MTEAAPALRTDPRGFIVRALQSLVRGALPAGAVLIGTSAMGALMIVLAVAGVAAVSFVIAWIKWQRFTYTVGAEDIRVEQGLLSHSARSVPYERIQDVSIERKWLPRLFDLAEVRFETGAGGKDEISLAYLSLEESERLRELVRERKDGVPVGTSSETVALPAVEAAPADVIFAMDNRRLITFGLFEFSLIIFAVLVGAAQQFDFLFPIKVWDWDAWRPIIMGGEEQIAGWSRPAQVAALSGAALAVVALGLMSGVVRTFLRDYGFRLERTAKGFRRRRGLFNKSDVLLPIHRVQAALVRTGLLRRRFGWYGLEFVSLAQDGAKTPHHSAAPFAKLDEIWPIVREAEMTPPSDATAWSRPSPRPWLYDTLFHGLFFSALGIGVGVASGSVFPYLAGALAVLGTVAVNYLSWRHHHHASDATQVFVRTGSLAPRLMIAPQVKLQSAEIVQSPLGRWRGYATLKLGLAGGKLDLVGLPLAEAKHLRAAVLDSVVAVDFSRLPR